MLFPGQTNNTLEEVAAVHMRRILSNKDMEQWRKAGRASTYMSDWHDGGYEKTYKLLYVL